MQPISRSSGLSRCLTAREERAHAVERPQNILGRVGVREPDITLAENAEIGAADDGDAGILQERGGKRLCLPAGIGSNLCRISVRCDWHKHLLVEVHMLGLRPGKRAEAEQKPAERKKHDWAELVGHQVP
jgi:hypothetical protein